MSSFSNIYRKSLLPFCSIRFKFMCYRGAFFNGIPQYWQVSNSIISPLRPLRTSIWSKKRETRCTCTHRAELVDGADFPFSLEWITRAVVLASHPPSIGGNRMLLDLCQSCCTLNQSVHFSQSNAICSSENIVNFVCLHTVKCETTYLRRWIEYSGQYSCLTLLWSMCWDDFIAIVCIANKTRRIK